MGIFSTGAGKVKREGAKQASARQGRASNLTTAANQWFDDPNRGAQRDQFMGALRTQLADNTDRGFTDTARQTKFATARQGLTGGRVDVDRQSRNLEDLFRRRISDEAQVQDAGQNLRMQDLDTRQSLIDGAYGAADVGQSAARSMLGAQAQNADYLSTILPNMVYGAGSGIARGYQNRAQMEAFLRGLQPQSSVRSGLAGLTIAPNARTSLPEGW